MKTDDIWKYLCKEIKLSWRVLKRYSEDYDDRNK